jgi:hypothetical protein
MDRYFEFHCPLIRGGFHTEKGRNEYADFHAGMHDLGIATVPKPRA